VLGHKLGKKILELHELLILKNATEIHNTLRSVLKIQSVIHEFSWFLRKAC